VQGLGDLQAGTFDSLRHGWAPNVALMTPDGRRDKGKVFEADTLLTDYCR